MGINAKAVNPYSFVVNMITDGKSISSNTAGQFLFKCHEFTIIIDGQKASIDPDNIATFNEVLANGRRILRQSESPSVKEILQETVVQQDKEILVQRELIEKQQEKTREQNQET
jgi:hypothetical protein